MAPATQDSDAAARPLLGWVLLPAGLVCLAAPAFFVLLQPWLGWLLLVAGVGSAWLVERGRAAQSAPSLTRDLGLIGARRAGQRRGLRGLHGDGRRARRPVGAGVEPSRERDGEAREHESDGRRRSGVGEFGARASELALPEQDERDRHAPIGLVERRCARAPGPAACGTDIAQRRAHPALKEAKGRVAALVARQLQCVGDPRDAPVPRVHAVGARPRWGPEAEHGAPPPRVVEGSARPSEGAHDALAESEHRVGPGAVAAFGVQPRGRRGGLEHAVGHLVGGPRALEQRDHQARDVGIRHAPLAQGDGIHIGWQSRGRDLVGCRDGRLQPLRCVLDEAARQRRPPRDHVRPQSGIALGMARRLARDGVRPLGRSGEQRPLGEVQERRHEARVALERAERRVPRRQSVVAGRSVRVGQRRVGRRPLAESRGAMHVDAHPRVGERQAPAGEGEVR